MVSPKLVTWCRAVELNRHSPALLADRGFLCDSSLLGVIESPAKVLEMWTLEAEAHHAAGSCFVLTNHPFISGRPSKTVALEQLISRVKAMELT